MSEMTVTVASDPERDELFAEIWHGDEQWGEVILDPSSGELKLEIFGPRSTERFLFELADVQQSLEEAKQRLRRLGYVPEDADGYPAVSSEQADLPSDPE